MGFEAIRGNNGDRIRCVALSAKGVAMAVGSSEFSICRTADDKPFRLRSTASLKARFEALHANGVGIALLGEWPLVHAESPLHDWGPHVDAIGCLCGESLADCLVRWCRQRGRALSSVAAIAIHPADRDFALECGSILALAGSGYTTVSAADALFDAPAVGGLEQALVWVLARVCDGDLVCDGVRPSR